MAEYLKFRLTAAKASVTLAFLALLGGLPGAAQAKQGDPSAKPASFQWNDPIYLKLNGLSGGVQKVFSKLELKLNNAFSTLSHKISTEFYDKHKINTTFLKITTAGQQYLKLDTANADYLKIDAANAEFLKLVDASNQFLKIESANAEFLKITDANTEFLKITDAASQFLKITDANNEFLKLDGTAADSNKLGGLTPDSFVQGHANVVSGAVTVNGDGKSHPLLQMPGATQGIIAVLVSFNSDGTPTVTVHNGTSALLPAVQMCDGSVVPANLKPGADNQLQLTNCGTTSSHEIQLQISPNPAAGINNVISILVSLEPSPLNRNQYSATGQMLIGNL